MTYTPRTPPPPRKPGSKFTVADSGFSTQRYVANHTVGQPGRPPGSATLRTRKVANMLAELKKSPLDIWMAVVDEFTAERSHLHGKLDRTLDEKAREKLKAKLRECNLDLLQCVAVAAPFIHPKLQATLIKDETPDRKIVYLPEGAQVIDAESKRQYGPDEVVQGTDEDGNKVIYFPKDCEGI